jgi:hypothetical protein
MAPGGVEPPLSSPESWEREFSSSGWRGVFSRSRSRWTRGKAGMTLGPFDPGSARLGGAAAAHDQSRDDVSAKDEREYPPEQTEARSEAEDE